MPQTNYVMPTLLLGQVATADDVVIDGNYVNELFAQLSEITFAGNDAGDYTIQIEGGGELISATITADGVDAVTVLIDDMIAALQVDPNFANLATAANADPDLDLTFLHEGIVYVITFPSNPSGNMSVASSQAAGGTDVGLGLCMAQGGGDDLAVPPTGVADFLLGITVRNPNVDTNTGNPLDDSVQEPGQNFSLLRVGVTAVQSDGGVTRGGPVFVRHANGTDAAPLGSLSSINDANTVQLPGARWRDGSTASGLTRVIANNP